MFHPRQNRLMSGVALGQVIDIGGNVRTLGDAMREDSSVSPSVQPTQRDHSPANGDHAPRRRRFRMLAAVAGSIALVGLLSFGVTWQTCGLGGCPDVAEIAAMRPGGAPVLVDRSGEVFGDLSRSRRRLVRLSEIPDSVADAFLAVEDKRFFEHEGIDWRRVGGAAFANVRNRRISEGFSTITMQLARSVFPERIPVERRTMRRKLLEIRVAREIEKKYSKDEILELFLNHVYLGNGVRGIEAAARHYYGIGAKHLTLAQAATLAALARSPAYYDPRRNPKAAKQRRDRVLRLMQEQGRITAAHLEVAKKSPVTVASRAPSQDDDDVLAPYAVENVRRSVERELGEDLYRSVDGKPLRVVTTLDSRVQRAAEDVLSAQLRDIEAGRYGKFDGPRYKAGSHVTAESTPYLQGAVIVMDARNGDVLAWVGGRDFEQSRFDRVESGRRQAGSAFKPFVLAVALDKGLRLSEEVKDTPLVVRLDGGRTWKPRNVADRSVGSVSLRDALVHSNNLATVRIAEAAGIEDIESLAARAGFGETAGGPSIALGAVTVSPADLTAAYTAFATGGTMVRPRLVDHIESADGSVVWSSSVERRPLVEPDVALLVTDVLVDAVRRGTGRAAVPKIDRLNDRLPVAGKTGTTNDVTDAWFIGYTPELVAGIWIGFDQPRPIVDEATAGRLAAPVFARLAERIYENRRVPESWATPPDVYEADAAPKEEGPGLVARMSAAWKDWKETRRRTASAPPEHVVTAERNSPPSTQPDDWEREPDTAGIGGWWTLSTTIDRTSHPSFRGLRLGYRVRFDQHGDRITGRGQKWFENGRAVAGAGRTSIVFDGRIRGREISLQFREHGTSRTTGGTLVLNSTSGSDAWSGSFRSSAADSSGSASARRIPGSTASANSR